MDGILKLFRSPLREGESPYTLGGIDQGTYEEGIHAGEKRPKLLSLKPEVLEDGRMMWAMMDTPENRLYCEAMLPTTENPSVTYSIGTDEDDKGTEDEPEVIQIKDGNSPDVITLKGKPRGRPVRRVIDVLPKPPELED